jgi:hypothetical protein
MPSGSTGPSGSIACAMSASARGHMSRQRVSGNIMAASGRGLPCSVALGAEGITAWAFTYAR